MAETNRQHWAQHHRDLAGDHDEMIKCHSDEMEKEKAAGAKSGFHKAAIAFHTKARDRELAKAAKCEKAEMDELNKAASGSDVEVRLTKLENTLQPTRVAGVIPNRPGVTAVPRAGQPTIPERPNVPLAFEHLVRVEE